MKDVKKLFNLNNNERKFDDVIHTISYNEFSSLLMTHYLRNAIEKGLDEIFEDLKFIVENPNTSQKYHFISERINTIDVIGRGKIVIPTKKVEFHINDVLIESSLDTFFNGVFDENQICNVFVITGIERHGEKIAYVVRQIN